MEVDEYLFDQPKHVVLHATIAVLILSVVAVAFTTAGFASQEVIGLYPTNANANAKVKCNITASNRKEGLFKMCMLVPGDKGKCFKRSYGAYPPDSNLEHYSVFAQIVEYRLALVICLAAGLLFALVAAVFSAIYLYIWYRTEQDTMRLLIVRLLISIILFCSGTLYQLGVFFIHLAYVKEKTSYTDMIPYLFPLWSLELKRNTEIVYGFCYYFFWVSLICVQIAAIIIVVTSIATTQYYAKFDEHDAEVINYNTRNSLPRFSIHEDAGIERLFLIDSP